MSEDRVVRWLSAGQLGGLRTGGRWWTSTGFLSAFLEARANRPVHRPQVRPAAAVAEGRLYAFKRRERA